MSTVKPIYFRLLTLSLIILGLVFLAGLNKSQAGNLQSVRVTMNNSRLSYRGKIVTIAGTIATIDIADGLDNYTTNEDTEITDVLKVGDELIFSSGSPAERTIQEIISNNTISLNSTVTTPNTFYLAETGSLKAEFTTTNHVAGGKFEVLVPASSSNSNDGIPDQGFFDFGTVAPTVSCTGANHTFTGTNQTAGVVVAAYPANRWHVYECTYTGGGANSAITMDISNIINPVPVGTHKTGVADTYDVIVRHLNGSGTEIDVTRIKIGVIEAVKVSATVAPSLSFTIEGQPAESEMCGVVTTTVVGTTASSVPFGELPVTTFTHATQILDVATNAVDGAVVTAIAYDQLGRNGGACSGKVDPGDPPTQLDCIWDANVASMTHETKQNWTTASTQTGFGYSIDNYADRANPAFEYDDDSGTFVAKHFADYDRGSGSAQTAQLIFDTDDSPTNSADVKVCYRINLDSITAAGEYYTFITYTATATF